MTEKEAIECIKKHYPPTNYTMLREALDLAMEKLEDMEPEFVKTVNWYTTVFRCPKCKTTHSVNLRKKFKFCYECGLKFDWKSFETEGGKLGAYYG